jgi:hypothetical protein
MKTENTAQVGNKMYASIWKTYELNCEVLQGYPLRQYLTLPKAHFICGYISGTFNVHVRIWQSLSQVQLY